MINPLSACCFTLPETGHGARISLPLIDKSPSSGRKREIWTGCWLDELWCNSFFISVYVTRIYGDKAARAWMTAKSEMWMWKWSYLFQLNERRTRTDLETSSQPLQRKSDMSSSKSANETSGLSNQTAKLLALYFVHILQNWYGGWESPFPSSQAFLYRIHSWPPPSGQRE